MEGPRRRYAITVIGEAFVDIRAKSTSFNSDAESGVLGQTRGIAGKVAAIIGGAFAAREVFDFAKEALAAGAEANKVDAQTAAVIKSTGGIAHQSAAQVDELAKAISHKTGIDDDQIKSGQNLLLTFTGVRNEVGKGNDIFNQATMAVTDMSVALGQDTKSSAIQLGKALNDPIKGVTALQRVGVSFTASQKEQIKTLVETGHTLDAQKLILKEINTEFGGSAAAVATPAMKMQAAWHEFQETLGQRVLPVVQVVAAFLMGQLPRAVSGLEAVFSVVGQAIRSFASAFQSADGDITSSGFNGYMERLGFIVSQVVAFIVANWPSVRDVIVSTLTTVIGIIQQVVGFVQANFIPVLAGVGAVVALVVVPAFIAWAVATASAAAATVVAAAPFIALAALVAALAFAIVYAYEHFQIFHDIVDAVATFLKDTVATAFRDIEATIRGVIEIVTGIIQLGLDLIRGDWGAAWDDVKQILAGAWDLIVSAIRGQFDVVNAMFLGLPGRILSALGDLGGLLVSAGEDLIRGLINGIRNMAGAAYNAAKEVVSGAVNGVKSFLGIGSPSKLFQGFGENIGQGLVLGMNSHQSMVATAAQNLANATTGAAMGGTLGTGGAQAQMSADIAALVAAVRQLVPSTSGAFSVYGTEAAPVAAVVQRKMSWDAGR